MRQNPRPVSMAHSVNQSNVAVAVSGNGLPGPAMSVPTVSTIRGYRITARTPKPGHPRLTATVCWGSPRAGYGSGRRVAPCEVVLSL